MNAQVDDLEALFDQVASESWPQSPVAAATPAATAPAISPVPAPEPQPQDMFHRLGSLTRQLHDALRELGYDKSVECAVQTLRGDARSRLDYVAKLTGEAAEKALTAVEKGQVEQSTIAEGASKLEADWARVFAGGMKDADEFRKLAESTRAYLAQARGCSERTSHELTAILMAQDFHDLTGQVIQRIGKLAESLEGQLVKLLLDSTPDDMKGAVAVAGAGDQGFLTGPAMKAEGRSDVVTNQAQVDDLLESLGF